jgi:PIN domain nuclease of toxin-antitoxin system
VELEKDTITDELKRLLELQQVNVNNVEKLSDSGRASTTDLADVQEKLTRARIELAQRQEQLSKSKGGNQIEALNSTLTNLSMQVAQYKAQIAGYERQLAQAEALLGKADDYELLSLKADIAKQSLQEVLVWRDRLSRQIRVLQPPTVSVIGAD